MGKNKRSSGRAQREAGPRLTKGWIVWGGLALGVVILLAALVAVQPVSSGARGDFRMVAYQGQDVLGGDEGDFSNVFAHKKPVVLNFWAGLCLRCRREMPGFQRVYDERGEDYTMVGVDVSPFFRLGSHEDARRFLAEFAIEYPTSYAVDRDPVRDYDVRSMPTTVFLNSDGQVLDTWTGFLPEDQLRRRLDALVNL